MMEYRMVRRALKLPATSTMTAHGGRKGREMQPFYFQPPPHRVTGTLASSSCSCWPLPTMSWSTYTHWKHQHHLLKDRNATYCSNNLLWWGNFCFPACFIFKLAFWWGGLEEIGNIHHFWFHRFVGTNSWCLRHRARRHQDNTKLQDNIFLALSSLHVRYSFPPNTAHCSPSQRPHGKLSMLLSWKMCSKAFSFPAEKAPWASVWREEELTNEAEIAQLLFHGSQRRNPSLCPAEIPSWSLPDGWMEAHFSLKKRKSLGTVPLHLYRL